MAGPVDGSLSWSRGSEIKRFYFFYSRVPPLRNELRCVVQPSFLEQIGPVGNSRTLLEGVLSSVCSGDPNYVYPTRDEIPWTIVL